MSRLDVISRGKNRHALGAAAVFPLAVPGLPDAQHGVPVGSFSLLLPKTAPVPKGLLQTRRAKVFTGGA